MSTDIADLARRLAREAEAVCRHYLSNGRRQGRYWIVGDLNNVPVGAFTSGCTAPTTGNGAAGKWTEYVASRVMLRPGDWALSYRRSTASTQHNVSAREIA